MRRISRFLVSHAFFAAACAVFLCHQTALLSGIPSDPQLLFFVFISTVLAYNFHYCMSEGYRRNWRITLFEWLGFSHFRVMLFFSPLVLVSILFLKLPPGALAVSMLLTIAYSFPLFPGGIAIRLRRFGWVKTVLLAFAWTWVTLVLPVAGSCICFNLLLAMLFVQRFSFMLLLCVIFDARDSETDALAGFNSLATRYPEEIIRKFIYATAGLLFIANCILGYHAGLSQVTALQLTLLVTLLVYRLSAPGKGFFFYYVLVDGLMIFTALMSMMARYLVNLPQN